MAALHAVFARSSMSRKVEMVQQRSALESAAAHGGVSYGFLPAERLRAILLGSTPTDSERPQVYQALSETPLYRLATLAKEIDLPFEALDGRFEALFGQSLEDAQQWTPGGH